jgi:hypothetical protein
MKESYSSSLLNDQKLNEIKAMLKNNQQLRPAEPVAQKPTLESVIKQSPPAAQIPVKAQAVQESEKVYKQERLSVKANLPPDYESPKIIYKNDELK